MNLRQLALCAILAGVSGVYGLSCKGKVNDSQPALLATVRVSLNSLGVEGNAEVASDRKSGDISDDGRYVVFASKATNLVIAPVTDTNTKSDVFLWDNLTRTTALVSANNAGTATGNGASILPSISGDGRYVAFASTADDLTPEDTDATQDIFVRDMQDANPLTATRLVSRASGPNASIPTASKAAGSCNNPMISKDGRYVVFQASAGAENLDGTPAGGIDNDAFQDIYRRDVNDPGGVVFATILISRASFTGPSPADGPKGTNDSQAPSISRNGNLIAFQSRATDLVSTGGVQGGPKVSSTQDIFVRDVFARTTIRVSVSATYPTAPDPNGDSINPSISGDGSFVVFASQASNLHVDDDGVASDIFLRNIGNTTTEILSVHSSGAQAGAGCSNPVASDTARYIVWDSPSSNLVNGDSNGVTRDVFMRDRTLGTTSRVSVASFGGELNGPSVFPAISRDGTYVVFTTQASNAADDDINGAGDFYMRGPPF
jgi:Tol biopolymer transport system component